ncbi:hypothetical protein [Azospirillum sp. ST 5-10]
MRQRWHSATSWPGVSATAGWTPGRPSRRQAASTTRVVRTRA